MVNKSADTEPATDVAEKDEPINARMIARWANAERSYVLQQAAKLTKRRAKLMLITQHIQHAIDAGKDGDVEKLSEAMVKVGDLRAELEAELEK